MAKRGIGKTKEPESAIENQVELRPEYPRISFFTHALSFRDPPTVQLAAAESTTVSLAIAPLDPTISVLHSSSSTIYRALYTPPPFCLLLPTVPYPPCSPSPFSPSLPSSPPTGHVKNSILHSFTCPWSLTYPISSFKHIFILKTSLQIFEVQNKYSNTPLL